MPTIMIIGGVPVSLIKFRGDLIKEWLRLGYKVIAIAAPANAELEEQLRAMGVEFRSVPIKRDGLNPFKDLKGIFSLGKIIKQEKPDLIFSYTVKPVIYSAICSRLIHKARLYPMISGLGYAFAGDTIKQRFVRRIILFLYKYSLRIADKVFFQNKDDLKLFKQLKVITGKQDALIVNGSGVNTEHYYFSRPKPGEVVSFLMIGRLLKSKGVKIYAEAAEIIKAKHKTAEFVLVGPLHDAPDSIDEKGLKDWQERGIINYLGSQKDVRSLIEACSVYVLPSYREGMPRSVLEAMSMGRAIITTDAPGCRETVDEGANGFLIPVRDSVALAEAMEKFIGEPALIEKMGRESRRIVEEKFDVRKVNQVILENMNLYEETVGEQ